MSVKVSERPYPTIINCGGPLSYLCTQVFDLAHSPALYLLQHLTTYFYIFILFIYIICCGVRATLPHNYKLRGPLIVLCTQVFDLAHSPALYLLQYLIHTFISLYYLSILYAAVSERSNVHAWKACVRQRTGGSNPPCSAN